ncbi:TetR family transcriptional regulator [Streptomyces endophyticus]|uniref:TetR family transcriptional regulator n=1 Tax=Streptomyces endophyticus TaxID=714166 RepID=A0ABU6F6C7_9ACTN|nr:TetR family transcriptional regulator [Streptomyces endophyticus]MEB8339576.1 TetR family transcriptional regulator [Streptomyces endophyticus]
MPRIASARPGAEPSSPRQHARRQSILRVASDMAADTGLEGVQMQEVARSAGVAIGTLYRYFPSKTHLFTAAMAEQIEEFGAARPPTPAAPARPEDAVLDALVRATRNLLRRPALATAMIQSSNAARAGTVPDLARVDTGFLDLLVRAWGVAPPTEDQLARLRLLILLWYGVLQSRLNESITPGQADEHLRMACALLLAARR